jgi:hypothetical protein
MEESNSYYDDRAAIIEKWIDNRWCAHSDPLYHPWHTTAAKMEVG